MGYFCFTSKKTADDVMTQKEPFPTFQKTSLCWFGNLLQGYHRKALLFVLKDIPYVRDDYEERNSLIPLSIWQSESPKKLECGPKNVKNVDFSNIRFILKTNFSKTILSPQRQKNQSWDFICDIMFRG